uniref:Mytilin 1 n=1 Tax=Perna canaliculus TaxID=38949 RepID=A0A6B9XKN7_PERCI|nr:mytilin 1 [Perna canaliculus]
MKAAFVSVILVVVVLEAAEVNPSCDRWCNTSCYNKGCRYYAASVSDGRCFCCCITCPTYSFYKVGHVKEMTPREEFNEHLMIEIQNHKN